MWSSRSGDSFCAGGDIGGMNENAQNKNFDKKTKVNDLIKKQEELTLRLFDLNLPTIAILPGPAAGAGMCLALYAISVLWILLPL